MTNVIISGAKGKMGSIVEKLITEMKGFSVVGLYDPLFEEGHEGINTISELPEADLIIDFCTADSIMENCTYWAKNYKNIIVGSSGLNKDNRKVLSNLLDEDQLLWVVPNFSVGAVLQKKWSIEASKYFKNVLIQEQHHVRKQDVPSGTSYDLALSMEGMHTGDNLASHTIESKNSKEDGVELTETLLNDIKIYSLRYGEDLARQMVDFNEDFEDDLNEENAVTIDP